MILKNKENEKYVKWGITAIVVIIAGLLCFSLFSAFKGFTKTLSSVISILAPFIYGAVIAYLIEPLCSWIEKNLLVLFKGKKHKLATALALVISLLLGVLVVLAVLLLLIPQVIDSVTSIVKTLPGEIETAWTKIQKWLQDQPEIYEYWAKYATEVEERINNWVKTGLPTTAKKILSGAIGGVYDTVTVVKNVLLGLIVSIYILARRRQMAAQGKLLIRGLFKPSAANWIMNEIRFVDRMFNGFFTGKLLDSAIVGILCFIGCLVLGLKPALLIAVIIGVTNIIPFFGPFIGAVPCALLLLLENPMHCLIFLIFLVVLQQLDGNFIGPRILGNTTGLPGLWVMFAILLFGGLWGIGGMILGVPLMAVLYDIGRQLAFYGIRRQGAGKMIDDYNAEYHPPVKTAKKKQKK